MNRLKKSFIFLINYMIYYSRLYKIIGTKEKVVLLYHRINKKEIISNYYLKSIFVKREMFYKQVKFLSHSERKDKVIITFDDGYLDNYEFAVPILDEFNIKAIFFITVNFILQKQYQWIDILNEYAKKNKFSMNDFKKYSKKIKQLNLVERKKLLKKFNVGELLNDKGMNVEQLKKIKHKHIIANHTMNHPNFSNETLDVIEKEIKEAKLFIEKTFSIKDEYFAYPDGDIGESIEVLNKLSYKYAFTTKRGVWDNKSNNFLINRIPIYYHDTLPIFVNKCYGINIEDNLSFRTVISKILSLIGIKEWVKRKLKF